MVGIVLSKISSPKLQVPQSRVAISGNSSVGCRRSLGAHAGGAAGGGIMMTCGQLLADGVPRRPWKRSRPGWEYRPPHGRGCAGSPHHRPRKADLASRPSPRQRKGNSLVLRQSDLSAADSSGNDKLLHCFRSLLLDGQTLAVLGGDAGAVSGRPRAPARLISGGSPADVRAETMTLR